MCFNRMTRKTIYISAGITIAVATIIAASIWLNISRKYSEANVLNHIPATATSVLKIQNLGQLAAIADSVAYGHELIDAILPGFDTSFADSLLSFLTSDIATSAITKQEFLISHLPKANDTAEILITMKIGDYQTLSALKHKIEIAANKSFKTGKTKLYSIELKNGHSLYLGATDGILSISSSPEMTEKSLVLPENETIATDSLFMDMYRSMSATMPISMIIRTNLLTDNFLRITTNPDNISINSNNWIELDMGFDKEMLHANGFLILGDNSSFAKTPNSSCSLEKIIPHNASNVTIFKPGIKETDTLQIEAAAHILANETALFTTRINGSFQSCIIIATTDSLTSITKIKTLLNPTAEPDQTEVQPTENLNITLNKADKWDNRKLSAKYLNIQSDLYYTWFSNSLIISISTEAINNIIRNSLSNNVLTNHQDYKKLKTVLSDRHQLMYYSQREMMQQLTACEDQQSTKVLNLWNKTGNSVIQTSSVNNMLYFNMAAIYTANRETEMPLVWDFRPDTALAAAPKKVVNHNTKEDEILLVDKSGKLYLLNGNGTLLWKRKISEGIVGNISQIDFFRNRKLQYLFNDHKAIYLVDRNGEMVAPFPVSLPFKAVNQVACFDYENDGAFRFFIAGDDNTIHVYDKKGEVVEGFNPEKTKTQVTTPVQHFRSSAKDYIVFHDDQKMYVTDRQGRTRIDINHNTSPATESRFHITARNTKEATLITNTSKNEWLEIGLANSKVEAKGVYFGDNTNAHLLRLDNQFAMLTDGKIMIIDNKGNVKFTSDAKTKNIDEATVVNNNLIAYYDKTENNIFLTDNNGVIFNNFPINGTMLPTIINDKTESKPALLVFNSTEGNVTAMELKK